TIVCKQITRIDKESRNFHVRSLLECFDIADTPCQSTHRVARSATGFEAAVNISAVDNRHRIAIIFAEVLLDLRRIDIEGQLGVNMGVARGGAGAAEL